MNVNHILSLPWRVQQFRRLAIRNYPFDLPEQIVYTEKAIRGTGGLET